MAITLEDGQRVWLKVAAYLSSHDEGGASSAAVDTFRALKDWMVSPRGNPQLQFIPYSAAAIVTNLGYAPIAVPCKVYGWYGKNTGGSGGTDSYITLHNAANNASVPFLTNLIQDDNDEFAAVYPRGIAFGTDITISGATTIGGATESAAADSADGFIIIGAA
jgi:hypothetical protein